MADKLHITLKKSTIGCIPKHREIVRSLGLHKLNQTVEQPDNPAIRGMIKKVDYLLKVEE